MSEETEQVEAPQAIPVEEPAAMAAEPAAEEPVEQAEKPSAPVKAKADTDNYKDIVKALGDIPEEPNDQLLESMTPESIEKLPDSVKGVLKHLMAQQNKQFQQKMNEVKVERVKLGQTSDRIQHEAKDLLQRRYELNKVLLDPKFQEYLRAAQMPEAEMKDPFTAEGMQQRIDKGVAQAMTEFQKPITEAAERSRQVAKYSDFVDQHPNMKKPEFKSQVRDLMSKRKQIGNPISLQDAYVVVDRDRMLIERESQRKKEAAARAKSNRKISRATMSSKNDPGDPLPSWVQKDGYKGVKGVSAKVLYLRDHPEKLKLLREKQKNGNR
jgi:hypothetical protein